MSTDQFDATQVVRIRLRTVEGEVWTPRLPRAIAETYVALGPIVMAIEFTKGVRVTSASIARWTHN